MNDTIKLLFDRKSVRAFEKKQISDDLKEIIFRSAIEAPTAGCQQLYTILDITDQELKGRLAVTCDNQKFIADALLVLVFLADCRRWLDSYEYANQVPRKPGYADLVLAIQDAVIAAQNTVQCAESLGIGSCYIGDIVEQEEEVRELLDLDEYVFPACMLVYGYPTEQQMTREKPKRVDNKYVIFENKYKRLSKEDHVDMFKGRGVLSNDKTYEDYIKAFFERKYMSDFCIEMDRSVKKYFKHFGDE